MPDYPEAPAPREIMDLESAFEKLEHELREINSSAAKLTKTLLEMVELKQVLRKTQNFFDEVRFLIHIILRLPQMGYTNYHYSYYGSKSIYNRSFDFYRTV